MKKVLKDVGQEPSWKIYVSALTMFVWYGSMETLAALQKLKTSFQKRSLTWHMVRIRFIFILIFQIDT